MRKNNKDKRDPTCVLKQPQIIVIQPQIKILKQQIRSQLSQILDFGKKNISHQKLVKLSFETQLPYLELLEIWNQSIVLEMKKFIFKLNTIINLQKSSNVKKFIQDVFEKLQTCSQLITSSIQSIATEKRWCFCNRPRCPVKFCIKYTNLMIKQYVLSNLSFEIPNPNNQNIKIDNQNLTFFNIKKNEECEKISLIRISQKNKEQTTVQQFLISLKINDKIRQNCNVDQEWINSLSQKLRVKNF